MGATPKKAGPPTNHQRLPLSLSLATHTQPQPSASSFVGGCHTFSLPPLFFVCSGSFRLQQTVLGEKTLSSPPSPESVRGACSLTSALHYSSHPPARGCPGCFHFRFAASSPLSASASATKLFEAAIGAALSSRFLHQPSVHSLLDIAPCHSLVRKTSTPGPTSTILHTLRVACQWYAIVS